MVRQMATANQTSLIRDWNSGDFRKMCSALGVRASQILRAMSRAPYKRLDEKLLWASVYTGHEELADESTQSALYRALRRLYK